MPPLAVEHVARAVDHTLLDPGAGDASLTALCREADEYGFAAVCVFPWWVPRARALLQGGAAVCTVVSFPHGLDAGGALDMLDAGATRIGTSNALSIIAELETHALAR